jgi:sigma-E factor negative regulatory protein RseC
MATEQGIVKTVGPGKAFVQIQRSEACSRCSSKGACGMLSNKEFVIPAINELEATVGDRVEVSVPTDVFLTASLLVYFIPVVALVIGAAVGWWAAPRWGKDPTLLSVFCAAAAMALTFIAVKAADRKLAGNQRNHPRITRIMPQNVHPTGDDSR